MVPERKQRTRPGVPRCVDVPPFLSGVATKIFNSPPCKQAEKLKVTSKENKIKTFGNTGGWAAFTPEKGKRREGGREGCVPTILRLPEGAGAGGEAR